MKKQKKQESTKSIQILLAFIFFVTMLIVISLSIKVSTLLAKSIFDDKHRFTMLVKKNNQALADNNIYIISFFPDTKKISIISLSGTIKEPVGKLFKIPIDASVILDNNSKEITKETIDQNLFFMITNYKSIKTPMTIIDLARLWFLVKNISPSFIQTKKITIPLEASEIDKLASLYFQDHGITRENFNIAIINGTDISGFGNRLARLINNMGGNVISVTTADRKARISEITTSQPSSYTARKFEKILGYKVTKVLNSALYDIIITIGKDKMESNPF